MTTIEIQVLFGKPGADDLQRAKHAAMDALERGEDADAITRAADLALTDGWLDVDGASCVAVIHSTDH